VISPFSFLVDYPTTVVTGHCCLQKPGSMFVIAVSGGVASGKSLFANAFADLVKDRGGRFDCDEAVHALLTETSVQAAIRDRFGNEVFDDGGLLDRRLLGERVFSCEEERRELEQILHPRVLEQAELVARELSKREEAPAYLVFEVPLLYEVDFPLQRDSDVVLACSPEVQWQRLREKRGLNDEVIKQMLAAQLPMEEKISRAEQVIWNDGCEDEVVAAAYLLKAWIDKKVGE